MQQRKTTDIPAIIINSRSLEIKNEEIIQRVNIQPAEQLAQKLNQVVVTRQEDGTNSISEQSIRKATRKSSKLVGR